MGILTRSGKVLCDSCAEALNANGCKSEFYADNYCDECGEPTFEPTPDHVKKCYGVMFNIGDPVYQHGNTEFAGNGVAYESFDGVFSCSSKLLGYAAEYSPRRATMVKVVRPNKQTRWAWMMDWCRKNGLHPADEHAWGRAALAADAAGIIDLPNAQDQRRV